MFTAFKLAIKSLFTNPVRTGLTTLGIIIGVATVVLVLSAGAGFRSLINDQVESMGTNAIFVEVRVPPSTKQKGNRNEMQAGMETAMSGVAITSLKLRDMEELKRLPNISGAYGLVMGQAAVSYKDVAKNTMLFGATASRFDMDRTKLEKGRFYTAQEDAAVSQVAILGNKLAGDMFGQEEPVGKILRVGELNFEVIGVYEKKGGMSGMNEDELVFMPLATLQKKIMGINYITNIIAETKDPSQGEATVEDIRLILRKNHQITDPDKEDFTVMTAAQGMEIFDTIFSAVTYLLIAIAAISLIVGGVGIMNIMYVVVTERTAEIGLKKALGAKGSDILSEFLIESILITLLGGLVGVAAGAFLGFVVAQVATYAGLAWTFSVPLYAIVIGVGVSAAIGIGFGVLPARSAAKLDPVEAMRYE